MNDEICAGLSPRQKETADLLIQGWSTKEIARLMGLSRNTVKNHIYNACQKRGYNNRVQLAVYWHRLKNGGGK